MPIIPLFDGRSNSCTLGGYKISGLSVQSQGIGVTDDGSGILRIIPEDHVRIRNAHTDQRTGRGIKAVAFRAFHRAVLDGGDFFGGIRSLFGVGGVHNAFQLVVRSGCILQIR